METPRESFRKIMHYQQPERMFNWNLPFGFYGGASGTQFWHQTVTRWWEEGLPADVTTHTELNDYFHADRSLRVLLHPDVWPPHPKEVVADDGEYETFYDEDGALVKQFKGSRFETSMPEHIRYPVTGRQDWATFKKERLDPGTPGRDMFEISLDGQTLLQSSPTAANFADARRLIEDSPWPVEITVGSLFGKVRNWVGLVNLSYLLYDDENLVADMITHVADLSLTVVTRFLEAIAAPIDYACWWEDMAFNNGPLLSPKFVEALMVPNYRRVNEYLNGAGVDIIGVDSDGNLDKLIPLWLEGGINFVYPTEVAAGNDVGALRAKYGRSLRLVGGIDKRQLAQGEEAIALELQRRLPLVAAGGYLPSVDHSVPPDISFANYTAYIEQFQRGCAHFVAQLRP